jgi:glucose-specific phosphotransferase system IIA component
MFNFFKKSFNLVAPIDGKIVDLTTVPDQVFSQKIMGDGIAVEPTGDIVVAPADGILKMIFKTNHAFALELKNGVELLVHIGLDTVNLEGFGFERIAQEGKKVKAGDPIMKIDRKALQEKGCSSITLIIITNMDMIKEIKYGIIGNVQAGKEKILNYKIK